MTTPITKTVLAALASVFVTACAGTTRDVTQIQRTQYAIGEDTASAMVRKSLDEYPLVERGESDRLETGWVRGRDGSAYRLVVHIDGPGGGPFMVRVEPSLRTKTGEILQHDIPSWLATERDRVVVEIYDRMKLAAIVVESPTVVAAQRDTVIRSRSSR